MRASSRTHPRRAVVLLAVLVVIVLLSLAAYKYGDLMVGEHRAAHAAARASQARALAESGIAYTAALLMGDMATTLNGNLWSNPDKFAAVPVGPSGTIHSGKFWVVGLSSPDDTSQAFRHGVTDECGKINLNTLISLEKPGEDLTKSKAFGVLMALPNMTTEIANAILDWLDPDDDPREGGAESVSYTALPVPYKCKNGPLDSLEELLLVQGVTPELLFGGDRDRNGIHDTSEGGRGDVCSQGWSAFLTVYSREVNFDSRGKPRVNINGKTLVDVKQSLEDSSLGIAPELVSFILAYRLYGGQPASAKAKPSVKGDFADIDDKISKDIAKEGAGGNKVPTLWDLANTQVSVTIGEGRSAKKVVVASPMLTAERQRVMLPPLLDCCTTSDKMEMAPRVNVVSAPLAVVKALAHAVDGLQEEDLQPILDKRPIQTDLALTQQLYKTTAWLLTEAELPVDLVKKLDRLVSSRSQVYRFQVLGLFDGPGPPVRVEAVIDLNQGRPRTVYWRDLSELGRGFPIKPDGN